MSDSIHRLLLREVQEALENSPVVLIHGARQTGKTTLAKLFERHDGYAYISFDDDVQCAAAQEDPKGFVADLPDKVILDEVQRVPELFTSLKYAVDQDPQRMGRFILTGSASLLHGRQTGSELAGRMSILQLRPLSQLEMQNNNPQFLFQLKMQNNNPQFLFRLFGKDFKVGPAGRRLGKELAELVAAGGYPAALKRSSEKRRTDWYRNYIRLVQADTNNLDFTAQQSSEALQDVPHLRRIYREDVLSRLLQVAAAYTAQPINLSKMAAPLQVSPPTIRSYTLLLSQVFLLEELPAWYSNHIEGLTKTAKLHMDDTGLACALLGLNADKLSQDRRLYGHMVETFVYQELKKQADWYEDLVRFHYYRDDRKMEVDLILEKGGSLYGLAVKAGSTPSPADLKGLRALQQAAGKRFELGVLLYDGDAVVSYTPDKSIIAAPISLLWDDLGMPCRSGKLG